MNGPRGCGSCYFDVRLGFAGLAAQRYSARPVDEGAPDSESAVTNDNAAIFFRFAVPMFFSVSLNCLPRFLKGSLERSQIQFMRPGGPVLGD